MSVCQYKRNKYAIQRGCFTVHNFLCQVNSPLFCDDFFLSYLCLHTVSLLVSDPSPHFHILVLHTIFFPLFAHAFPSRCCLCLLLSAHTFNRCFLIYFRANSSELFQYKHPQLNIIPYCILLAQNTAKTDYSPHHSLESHPQGSCRHSRTSSFLLC